MTFFLKSSYILASLQTSENAWKILRRLIVSDPSRIQALVGFEIIAFLAFSP